MKNESEISALIDEAIKESKKALEAGDVTLAMHYAKEATDLLLALTGPVEAPVTKQPILH